MNDKLEKKLEYIRNKAEEIMSNMQCVLDDLEVFEGYDELFTIESAMNRTVRQAEDTITVIRNAYDDLSETEEED